MTAGEVDLDSVEALPHQSTDLGQSQTEGNELHAWHLKLGEPLTEHVEEPVGGRMQQQAELIRHKGMVAQPIAMAGTLEVLDAVLGWPAAAHVPVIEIERLVGTRRHDEAGIRSLGQGPCLIDHPALMRLGASSILHRSREPDLLAGLGLLLLSLDQQWCSQGLEARIGDEADGVGDAVGLTEVIEGRQCKAATSPDLDLDTGPALPQTVERSASGTAGGHRLPHHRRGTQQHRRHFGRHRHPLVERRPALTDGPRGEPQRGLLGPLLL